MARIALKGQADPISIMVPCPLRDAGITKRDGFNEISPPSVISDLSNELLVEFILYGNERLPPDVNKRLIEATLKFIHATKRF